jgi:hypothetical protein
MYETAFLEVEDSDVYVRLPFGYKEELKSIGGRWRPDRRSWVFPVADATLLVKVLRKCGLEVDDIEARRPVDDWAEHLFRAIPERLHDGAFRALLHVLHPDHGGDRRACQILNDARPRKAGVA